MQKDKINTLEETLKHKRLTVFFNAKKFLVTALKNANGYMFSECICGATMAEFNAVEKYVSSELGTI